MSPKPAVLLGRHRKLRKRPWAVRKPKYWPVEHPDELVELDIEEIRTHRQLCPPPVPGLPHLHSKSSLVGNSIAEKQSVTNLLDEYTPFLDNV